MKTLFALFLSSLATIAFASSQDDALKEIWQDEWEFRASEFPSVASQTGPAVKDRLARVGERFQQRRRQSWQQFADRLAKIKVDELSDQNRINYAILKEQIQDRITQVDTRAYLITMNSDWGFHNGLLGIGKSTTLQSEQDARDYLSLLEAVVLSLEEHTQLMREGMTIGMTPPKVVLAGREVAIEPALVDSAQDSHYFKPFQEKPNSIDAATWGLLEAEASSYIDDQLLPAWNAFYDFFLNEYVPAARTTLAAESVPNGEAFYRGQIQLYTTLDRSPRDIHKTGLDEVARIRKEMQEIIDELQYEGSFADFIEFLRTDEQFYAKSERELLMVASYYSKKIDGELPKLFGKLPRLPYAVKPVPAAIAPYYTTGRYSPGSVADNVAGEYWVNTSKLESRPTYALPALTLHEAVPGHHLQGALTQEMTDLPNFRRFNYISAYGEGWALYTERLGVEVDFYETPYDHFGRLTYEMWRACRLVIDTGVHHMGWTRQQALDYLANNTALSMHEVTTEVDRYISWPAQALSYKLGELEIWKIRRKAEAALGDRFDIRAFHDALMALGPVPMSVMNSEMDRWIETESEVE